MSPKRKRPGQLARANRPSRGFSRKLLATYCFGGVEVSAGGVAGAAWSAGGDAGAAWSGVAVPEAGGVDAESAAGAAGAGGVAAWSVPADSCFAQAVSISAATIALRASLVFIDRYPEEARVVLMRLWPLTVVPRTILRPRSANSIEVPVRLETCTTLALTWLSGRGDRLRYRGWNHAERWIDTRACGQA